VLHGAWGGVVTAGQAAYSIGTYILRHALFPEPAAQPGHAAQRSERRAHVVPGQFVSFLYNLSGGRSCAGRGMSWLPGRGGGCRAGRRHYDQLLAEMPEDPTGLMVLPHFCPLRAAHLRGGDSGVILGLKLETSRGELIKGPAERA